MDTLHLGSDSEFVRIAVPASFTADGWAQVSFEVSVQCFRGAVQPFLERSDLERLLLDVVPLYESLAGKAELAPLETQVSLTLSGNGRGAIKVSGSAASHAAFGSTLEFEFELDQTYLPPFITELQALLAKCEGSHA
jgi:hypothetical protein